MFWEELWNWVRGNGWEKNPENPDDWWNEEVGSNCGSTETIYCVAEDNAPENRIPWSIPMPPGYGFHIDSSAVAEASGAADAVRAVGGYEVWDGTQVEGGDRALSAVSTALAVILVTKGSSLLVKGSPAFLKVAKKLKLNPNSASSVKVIENAYETVQNYISKHRLPSVRGQMPGEFLNKTVMEAIQSGNTTVRKLLVDQRWAK